MASAVLEIANNVFPLKNGIYLIRGQGALNAKSEFNLKIESETVDDKHALIISETDCLFVCDLDTKIGTFVNGVRLPVLIKFKISENVSIRFGTIEGKLNKCPSLEHYNSSGFHDESLHLALDQTSEAENLTIPETQCISPEHHIYADGDKSSKSTSIDITIPETQDILEQAETSLPKIKPAETVASLPLEKDETVASLPSEKDDQASLFCISSQEFNDCVDGAADTNSRDFLDNLNWLMGDEQATAIEQATAKSNATAPSTPTPPHPPSNAINNDDSNKEPLLPVAQMETDAEQEDELRSQTHTPDLFNVELLDEFDKKEARMNNAKANRAQNRNALAEDTETASTKDTLSEERTQTASEKSLIDEPQKSSEKPIYQPSAPPPVDKPIITDQPSSTRPTKSVDQIELDLFEGEKLQNDILSGPPLQHSNKENMLMGDLEPTQVFIKKKAMKPPVTMAVTPAPPPQLTTGTTTTATHDPVLPSDLEPTQVFVPKKNKDTSTRKSPAPGKQQLLTPVDEKDLEPTQKFVPKKSSKNTSKASNAAHTTANEVINLNSTMEPAKRSPRSFFAEADESAVQEDQPSSSVLSAGTNPILLTPEIISKTFAGQKVPDSEDRRKFLLSHDFDSDSDDSLTRLLTKPRIPNDFNSLIKSIEKESPDKKDGEDQSHLIEKYMVTKQSESPRKKPKLENKSTDLKDCSNSGNSSTPSRSLRGKRIAREESSSDSKRLRQMDKDVKKHSNDKTSDKGGKRAKVEKDTVSSKVSTLKPIAPTVDDKSAVDSKTMKFEENTSNVNEMKTLSSTQEVPPEVTGRSRRRIRNPSNSSQSSAVTKATSSSSTITAKSSQESIKKAEKKQTQPSKRGRTQSSTTAADSSQEIDKKGNEKAKQPSERGRTRRRSQSQDIQAKVSEKDTKPSIGRGTRLRSQASIKAGSSSQEIDTIADEKAKQPSKRGRGRLRSQTSTETATSIQTATTNDEDSPKPLKMRRTRLKTTDSASESTLNVDRNSKNIKPRKDVKNASAEPKPKALERSSSIIEIQGKRTRSRMPSTIVAKETDKVNDDEIPSTSKATIKGTNNNNEPSATSEKSVIKLSFTMVEPEKKEELLKHANSKWLEAKDPTESEVLVMDNGNRTLKFLVAVAKGIPIVTTKWLDAIQSTGVPANRSKYIFKDIDFERNFKFSLLHTLNEARKAKLFTNFEFLLTSNIVPSPKDMKMIITCAGGTILERENIPKEKENQELYLISSERDRQHWHGYRRKNTNLCITNTEAIMLAVMRYNTKILKMNSL